MHVEKTRRIQKRASWALAAAFVGVMVILGSTVWGAYRTSQREASVFASVSAIAFGQGFCDRALRLAVAGLPPDEGAFPLSFRSRQLQSQLSFLGTARDCHFRLALAGHMGLISGVAFSPDGSRIVSSSWDKTARVWDVRTGVALATLSGHKSWVNSAAFSPDGNRIVSASWDKTARVWDSHTGAMLVTLLGHVGPVNSAAFSPDGSRIVTSSNDNTARVWDATTGTALATFSAHEEAVDSVAFSPDGSRVVTASFDGTAQCGMLRPEPR